MKSTRILIVIAFALVFCVMSCSVSAEAPPSCDKVTVKYFNPIIKIDSYSPTESTIYICLGTSVDFSASGTDKDGYDDPHDCLAAPVIITWTNNAGVPGDEGSNYTFTPTAGGKYTVTATFSDPPGQGFGDDPDTTHPTKVWTVYAYQVKIMYENNDITGQTVETIVSKGQGLTAAVIPDEITQMGWQWSIDGKIITDYTHEVGPPYNTCKGEVVNPVPADYLLQEFPGFCWVDSGSKEVSCQVLINNNLTCSGNATFTVLRPTVSITTVTGTVRIVQDQNGNPLIKFVNILPGGIVGPGIEFTRSNFQEPSGWQGGTTKWVQVINTTTRDIIDSNALFYRLSGSHLLDSGYPFPASNTTYAVDGPANGLADSVTKAPHVSVGVIDTFTMYLMYCWDANSIDVPLRKVDWYWNGDEHYDILTQQYVLDGGTGGAEADRDTTDHPTWVGNALGLQWVGQVHMTTTSLPNGTANQAYNQTLTNSGGKAPFTWTYSGDLPPGLSMDPSTGVISGTPTTPGTYPFTVQVTDSSVPPLTDTIDLTITIL